MFRTAHKSLVLKPLLQRNSRPQTQSYTRFMRSFAQNMKYAVLQDSKGDMPEEDGSAILGSRRAERNAVAPHSYDIFLHGLVQHLLLLQRGVSHSVHCCSLLSKVYENLALQRNQHRKGLHLKAPLAICRRGSDRCERLRWQRQTGASGLGL